MFVYIRRDLSGEILSYNIFGEIPSGVDFVRGDFVQGDYVLDSSDVLH